MGTEDNKKTGEMPLISEKKSWWDTVKLIVSIVAIIIASISLDKSCKAIKISKMNFEEPRICIKEFVAMDWPSPIDIYDNENFKEDPNFRRTQNKIIKDNIENSLIIVNDGSIAATPLGDTPSAKIKILVQFPFRIFNVGISGVPKESWRWVPSYNQDKSQSCIINIYEDFQPQKEFKVILIYFVEKRRRLEALDVNQILSRNFKVSTWSPRSKRSRECLWKEGEIIKPEGIFENK